MDLANKDQQKKEDNMKLQAKIEELQEVKGQLDKSEVHEQEYASKLKELEKKYEDKEVELQAMKKHLEDSLKRYSCAIVSAITYM